MNIFKLAYKNIISKPLNLLLSVVLFALGIGLISFLLLVNTQIKEQFDANLAGIDLVIGAKGSPLQMILCNMYHIDAPTGNISIHSATPFLRDGHPLIAQAIPLSLGDNYRGFRIVGTDHRFLELYNAEIWEGDLWGREMEVTLGKRVADQTGLKIGDTFFSSHGFIDEDDMTHDHHAFRVTGILKPSGSVADQLILTANSSVWLSHDHDSDDSASLDEHQHHYHDSDTPHYHYEDTNQREILLSYQDLDITSILVKYRNRTNFQALNLPRNINENTDMQAANPAYEINRLYAMMGTGTNALRSLAILIAFVSAISIFIFLLKSLRERKYELALIRVLGGGRNQLFLLVILEGLILAVIGFVTGTLLSHGSMEILANYLKADFRYVLTGWVWLREEWGLFLLSLLLGFIAALIPAMGAYRTDIHETLSGH